MKEYSVSFDGLTLLKSFESLTLSEIWKEASSIGLTPANSYLTQDGRILQKDPTSESCIRVQLRLLGGKGGFGSMLRAIGAQIEKTTNREACRDLSGRRLKDINEEKRLREWLEKQNAEPEDPSEKFQKKISKLLAKPKHEFKDEQYEKQRDELTANMDDAVEQGLKRIQEEAQKRKAKEDPKAAKKMRGAVWTGLEDLSSESDEESEDEDFQDETMQNILSLYLREREKLIEKEEKDSKGQDAAETSKEDDKSSETPEVETKKKAK